MHRRCDSDRGISQSRHSRRIVPMTRSQIELAIGLRGGDFKTLTPSLPIDSSRRLAIILSRSRRPAYVAARAPDAGEDFAALAAKFPKPPASAGVLRQDGFFWLNEEAFVRDFAGDIEPSRARALYAVQGRGADALPNTKTTTAAWRVKPTWYQVSTADRTIDPGPGTIFG